MPGFTVSCCWQAVKTHIAIVQTIPVNSFFILLMILFKYTVPLY
ncbi:hypothetical protein M23134_02872 [Microscilla marina ATCC 23134]|uniref:Uncharacterized protein n=1 Tax=Microscilla marina ATCC 23134 TaxID=313606 RepID=A1ZPW9_MICM2|nr:hypothetical protein M23134_02872 [Microscilla marina ATCC 23134]